MSPEPIAPGGASVVLALGSNLGDRAATLAQAARAVADIDGLEFGDVSPVFESAAVKPGGVDPDAPAYLNAVVTARYAGDPYTLLDAVNAIEQDLGRVRAERWGDRTIDIDIIVFGDLQLAEERLTVPHPRAWERDFVLVPWLHLDPDAVIPGRGRIDALGAAGGGGR
ncbi:MAG: 2-amino-4-hydroxy-6-hydroxymethyldihydropteridine diphosphokinase [Cryobacterium sp.]